MNNHKFFRNAALAFGLLAAGSSFAAETSATAPAANTPEQREAISTEIRSKMANMTPEQRETFRDKMQAEHHEAHADINHEHMHPSDMHGAGNMHPR